MFPPYIPHIFKDKNIKDEMLKLRREGFSYSYLSKRFKVNHSTIIYHCRKEGIAIPRAEIIMYRDSEDVTPTPPIRKIEKQDEKVVGYPTIGSPMVYLERFVEKLLSAWLKCS